MPNEKVAPAQVAALQKWGAPAKDPYAYLKKITQPTLVVNGSNDAIVYTVNSFILQQNLPDAQLILYLLSTPPIPEGLSISRKGDET
ncbi:MAG: alpha/beta hydrolase [Bryobacterales bacterium]|nr:alpha/beta hydrolase [Bryobacterales bacterium]